MLRRADDNLRVALVTGACSGIGIEVARILGSLGYTLVLVSQREGPLASAAEDIRSAHGVPVHSIRLDLARPEAAGELFDAVTALGLDVDVLVNNAACSSRARWPTRIRSAPTPFSSSTW